MVSVASHAAFRALSDLATHMLDRDGSYLQWQHAVEQYYATCVAIVGHGEVAIETAIHRDTPSAYGRMISRALKTRGHEPLWRTAAHADADQPTR